MRGAVCGLPVVRRVVMVGVFVGLVGCCHGQVLADKGGSPALSQMTAAERAASIAQAEGVRRGAESITPEHLMATVKWLAAPEREGRLAGSPGYLAAARHMARRFADLGLEAGGEDGYFQHFALEYNEIREPVRLDLVAGGQVQKRYRLGPDFVCRGFSGGAKLTAPVVFCGYGLSLPERGYDDYAGVDVRGKVVLVFKQAPSWKLADEEGWERADQPRPKSRVAAEHGAVGLIMASVPAGEKTDDVIGSVLHGDGEQDISFPQLHVTQDVAADLLAGSGFALGELRAAIDSTHAPHSVPLSSEVAVEVHTRYVKEQDTVNVVGILPGTDPELADRTLVIGAHLDHVGKQGNGVYFPGANDNASGSAALLDVARAFARGRLQPRLTVVFVLFAGEEQGLFGARHYVESPARPLAGTVAMLNLDCVACGDSIQVGCGKSCPRLWDLARKQDQAAAQLTVERTWDGGGADASPFHDAGLPTLYFHTLHGYGHLHRPDDTPETLNPTLHAELARLVFRTAAVVAAGDYPGEATEAPAEASGL